MIDVLIVDLDGVLRLWDESAGRLVEQRHGLAPGSLQGVAFEPALLAQAVTGRISDQQWRAQVAVGLGGELGIDATKAVVEWSESCGRIDPVVLDLLRRQRQQRQVVLLTNATSRLHADLAELGVTQEFDEVFSSAELGIAKPDSRAFTEVWASLGVAPGRCAVVDDSPANIRVANALGMTGYTYRTAAGLQAFLEILPLPAST